MFKSAEEEIAHLKEELAEARVAGISACQRIIELKTFMANPEAPVVVHEKSGGHYKKLMEGCMEATLEEVVVYMSTDMGTIWVRPKVEFDERFKQIQGGLCLDGKLHPSLRKPITLRIRSDQAPAASGLPGPAVEKLVNWLWKYGYKVSHKGRLLELSQEEISDGILARGLNHLFMFYGSGRWPHVAVVFFEGGFDIQVLGTGVRSDALPEFERLKAAMKEDYPE